MGPPRPRHRIRIPNTNTIPSVLDVDFNTLRIRLDLDGLELLIFSHELQ